MTGTRKPEHLFYEEIQACEKCDLCSLSINKRKGKTPGAGYMDADIVVLGLATGFYRDKDVFSGTPFNFFNEELYDGEGMNVASRVRKALEEMLKTAGIDRENVFITNIMKCSTPKDREPENEEIAACFNWFNEEIAAIKPKMIICLGQKVSSFFALKPMESQKQGNTIIIASYHPAYSVYSGNKRFFRELKEEIEKYE